ncbi:DUF4912 domain-containing protein [Desulfofundulus thermosubterraneus]|uniref:DUF4912 domain-containing protein n=1 Tax=Desulfofundulus thermosubterraneus DSM 16057 TaxID=1121432 RepID=A0A1M6K899_9FIRM|nr:DUF4912 domain-containing protein [Desulfofundulus thermosubterraneus]SHJ55165.1 hypothetical protein SAMN02745219_02816 [Desulfofundulus thermosubterraneus DSM 16057]
MTALVPLFFGIALVVLFLVVFLWTSRRRGTQPAPSEKVIPPLFTEEVAEELALPAPPVESPPLAVPELPRRYGVDRLVLLVRDPYWLYAYWEITATRQEEFNATYGPRAWNNTRPVLRVYDVTGVTFNGYNANSYMDINVQEEVDNWHIPVGQPNRSFCVDLGRMFPDGRFITLLRSNVVTTPRSSLSECLDEEWMWIEGVYRSYQFQFGVSSPMLIQEVAGRAAVVPLGISSPGFGPPVAGPKIEVKE